MTVFLSVVGIRIIFITGLTNLFFGLLVLFSCRWVPIARITRPFSKSRGYQRFFRLHNYFWWLFWISIAVHVPFAISYVGFPF
jgi:choline-glycine betaine transporter